MEIDFWISPQLTPHLPLAWYNWLLSKNIRLLGARVLFMGVLRLKNSFIDLFPDLCLVVKILVKLNRFTKI
jgi:hypothetical protein